MEVSNNRHFCSASWREIALARMRIRSSSASNRSPSRVNSRSFLSPLLGCSRAVRACSGSGNREGWSTSCSFISEQISSVFSLGKHRATDWHSRRNSSCWGVVVSASASVKERESTLLIRLLVLSVTSFNRFSSLFNVSMVSSMLSTRTSWCWFMLLKDPMLSTS